MMSDAFDCSHSCTCRSHDSGSSASLVDLKLTHLDWDAESALIHFQGQYLSTCEADYCALTAEIQRFPKTHVAVDVGEICLVEDRDSAQWFRGRVQNREESSYDVLLIDEGNVVTVDVSRISSCPEELLTLPPKLICGFLADVLLFQSCCQSSVDKFFSNLIGRNLTGFVHGTLPHHVVLLEAPDINRDLVQHGFGRHVDSDTFLCLVEMLTDVEFVQKSDPLSGKQRVRPLLQRYRDFLSFCGPRLACGTEAEVRVTAAFNMGLFYCRMVSSEADLSKMSSQIGASCDREQKSQQSLDELCAVKGKDEKWYRGFLLSAPIPSHLKVFFIDCGYFETVRADSVHKLPALGFNSAPLAFPCRLAAVTDRDEKAFRAGLLGGVLTVNIGGFQKEPFLYTVTITGVKEDLSTDPEPPEEPSSKARPLPPPKGAEFDGSVMCDLLSQTLAEEKIRGGSAFEGYVQFAKDPENFWVVSASGRDACQEMAAKMKEHYEKQKLCEDVLVDPKRGAMCCALYEADMHFYRAVVLNNLSYGAEVLFIDYGNIEKVPHIAIKNLPETFSSRPAFAVCCGLDNVVPTDDFWTTESCDFFREAVMGRTLQVHVVQLRKHKVIVDLFRKGSPASVAELLTSSKLAHYISMVPKNKGSGPSATTARTYHEDVGRNHFKNGAEHVKGLAGFTALSLKPGSQFPVCCSHISSLSEFWCQPRVTAPALEELMLEIQQYYDKHTVPFQPGDRCCVVRSPLDDRWYRGAVVEQKTDAFRVRLVDWGPTLQVIADRLQGLKLEFVGLEGQAFRCSLNRPLSRDGPDGADLLRTFVLDGPEHLECQLVCVLKVKGEGPCHVVRLYNTLTRQSVNSRLAELGPTGDGSEPTAAVCPESFVYSAFGLSAGNRERVYVTHVSSQREFYCQLGNNTGAMKELDRVTTVLCESGQPSGWDGVQKKPCLAKYLDGKWYRCSVLRAAAPPYVFVFFVDYGNTYICEKNNIAAIPAACRCLLDTPMQALKCNLVAVSNRPLCADAKGWLMDAALDRSMTAVVTGRRKDGSFDVDLYDGNVHVNQKVRELLAKLSLNPAALTNACNNKKRHSRRNGRNPERRNTPPAAKASRNSLWEDKTKDLQKAEDKGECKKRTKSSSNAKQAQKPVLSPQQSHGEEERRPPVTPVINKKIGPGFRARAFTSFFTSVSSFFLQLSEDQAAIWKMEEDLNSDAVRDSLTPVSCVRNGDMVLAEFVEDGALYRSVVQSREGGSFGVDFIDYGNSAAVGREKIFALPEEHRRQHRLSVACSLLHANTYTGDAALADAMLETPLLVEFVCQSGLQWQVRVVVLDPKDEPEGESECQNRTRPPGSPAEQSGVCEEELQNTEPLPASTIKAGDPEPGMVLSDRSAGLQEVQSERLDGGVQVQNSLCLQNADEDLFLLDPTRPAQQQRRGLPRLAVSTTPQCGVEGTWTQTWNPKAEEELLLCEEDAKASEEVILAESFSEEGPAAPQPLHTAPVETDRAYAGVAASVTTPSDFSVALDGWLLSMVEVSLLLDELVEAAPPLSDALPGSCCLFQAEQRWCRTQIVGTDSALILDLVDYGYQRCVPLQRLSELKKLPEELSKIPRLTLSCSLRGVRAAAGRWSEEAALFFKELVCQKNLQIFFRERLSGSRWGVDVVADGVHAATELENAGLALQNQVGGPTERRLSLTAPSTNEAAPIFFLRVQLLLKMRDRRWR